MKEQKHNTIWNDDVCVYVSSAVSNPLKGKIILLLSDLFILVVTCIAIKEWIPGLLIMSVIMLLFLSKYTLWNLWGKENLIINTKSFSYQHDYGLLKRPYVTKIVENKIIINATKIDEDDDTRLKLSFISYHEMDNIPYEVYTMSFFFQKMKLFI